MNRRVISVSVTVVSVTVLCVVLGFANGAAGRGGIGRPPPVHRLPSPPPPATRDVDRSQVCMVQDTVQMQAGLEATYENKSYYFSCPTCKSIFEYDPQRYSKARDPVTGQRVDKATAPVSAYGGHAFFFASEASRAAFAKDPERYVRGALGEQRTRP